MSTTRPSGVTNFSLKFSQNSAGSVGRESEAGVAAGAGSGSGCGGIIAAVTSISDCLSGTAAGVPLSVRTVGAGLVAAGSTAAGAWIGMAGGAAAGASPALLPTPSFIAAAPATAASAAAATSMPS